MIDVSKQVQAAYDQMVEAYASRNHSNMPDNLITLARKLIQHAGHGAHVIDVGCGTGRDMAWLETHGVTVTGIDLSSGMIAYARRYVKGALLLMDMRNLAFHSARFDGAWCCASLLHLPKSEAPDTLKEIRRVLKSGGMLILSVQEGNGEGWEDGYVEGAKRFFARYAVDEMKAILSDSQFAVRETSSSHAGTRDWLSFVCVAH